MSVDMFPVKTPVSLSLRFYFLSCVEGEVSLQPRDNHLDVQKLLAILT